GRRNFPAPPPGPCRGSLRLPPGWGGTADWHGTFPDSYWGSRPWRHPAGPPPCPTCGWPLAAPAWPGLPRKTAIGRTGGPLPPRPPDRPCAVSGASFWLLPVPGAIPHGPPLFQRRPPYRRRRNDPAPASDQRD